VAETNKLKERAKKERKQSQAMPVGRWTAKKAEKGWSQQSEGKAP